MHEVEKKYTNKEVTKLNFSYVYKNAWKSGHDQKSSFKSGITPLNACGTAFVTYYHVRGNDGLPLSLRPTAALKDFMSATAA